MATAQPVPGQHALQRPDSGAWAEVRLEALRSNLRAIRAHVGAKVAVAAVVKADAYGHGLVPGARAFVEAGAAMLAVARLDEALELRGAGFDVPIVILGATGPEDARLARHKDISLMIGSPDWLDRCASDAKPNDPPLKVHLMVDTAMGRIGVRPEQCLAVARQAAAMPDVELEGVATHFATADEPDLHHAEEQLTRFREVVARLLRDGIRTRWVHAANSAATQRLPHAHFNLVRCGISLYGLKPSHDMPTALALQPALRVVSRVAAVRDLPAGATVGYGRHYTAEAPMRTATVAIGYGDGYSRGLSGRGVVTFDGRRLPVLGRVSMDQIVVDARPAPALRAGDVVTVFSDSPADPNSIDAVARELDTISYEVTCLLTPRVRRLHVDG